MSGATVTADEVQTSGSGHPPTGRLLAVAPVDHYYADRVARLITA